MHRDDDPKLAASGLQHLLQIDKPIPVRELNAGHRCRIISQKNKNQYLWKLKRNWEAYWSKFELKMQVSRAIWQSMLEWFECKPAWSLFLVQVNWHSLFSALTSHIVTYNPRKHFFLFFFCYRRNQQLEKRDQGDQCLVQRSAQESDAGALDVGSVKIASERTVASAEPVKIWRSLEEQEEWNSLVLCEHASMYDISLVFFSYSIHTTICTGW